MRHSIFTATVEECRNMFDTPEWQAAIKRASRRWADQFDRNIVEKYTSDRKSRTMRDRRIGDRRSSLFIALTGRRNIDQPIYDEWDRRSSHGRRMGGVNDRRSIRHDRRRHVLSVISRRVREQPPFYPYADRRSRRGRRVILIGGASGPFQTRG